MRKSNITSVVKQENNNLEYELSILPHDIINEEKGILDTQLLSCINRTSDNNDDLTVLFDSIVIN